MPRRISRKVPADQVRVQDLRPTVACHPLCSTKTGCHYPNPRYKACNGELPDKAKDVKPTP